MARTVLALSAVLAAGALAACGSSSSGYGSSASGSKASPETSPAATSAAPAAAAGSALRIASYQYHPGELSVAPGQEVQVTNTDGAQHTVTSDLKGLFLADDVAQGTTVTFKAPTKPGTYTFHCQYHSSMHGTLVVTG